MLLTLTTTREPATDLGFLLVKHPDRVHEFDLPTGTAYVCFPEATSQRCTAALLVEVDPAKLSSGRRRAPDEFALGRFVNDRQYAASSLLAVALNRAFRSAMRGESRDRPELAGQSIPLEIQIPALRCRGGAAMAVALLEPLGWTAQTTAVPLDPTQPDWGESPYLDLRLSGSLRLADALNQLYVLLPVFDDAKHYWVAPDEIDKLIRGGAGWLADHPERGLITRRYLAHRRGLETEAAGRLDALRTADDRVAPNTVDDDVADADLTEEITEDGAETPAPVDPAPVPLAELRRRAVRAELGRCGALSVVDLGCGSGTLLAELVKDKRFSRVAGVDVSGHALRLAERRLRLDRMPERARGRVTLLQSALTYTDDRLVGFDAAVLMEVVEHVDLPRLPALAAAVFGHARPSTVVVTTPNAEYNGRYEGLAPGAMRHRDHRFEWTRGEFGAWCDEVARDYGYHVRTLGVGDDDPDVGAPTQLATFTRLPTNQPATNRLVTNPLATNPGSATA